ncbi:unnamed protein product [Cylicocyclus nassatus]|uniref:histone deacetylase n=1 Tax=Cylicocyclus nassatus TaxID=53992 RepID=A0AA36HEY1_CYLNA|nr:unnamed protein product [Cylicocyclus nassatus]
MVVRKIKHKRQMSEGGSSTAGDALPSGSGTESASSETENLSLIQLQEVFKQKQMDLMAHFERAQQALNMQHLQQYYQTLQQHAQQQAVNSITQVGPERMDEGVCDAADRFREIKIGCFGVDGAGKTTILKMIKGEDPRNVLPTNGFSMIDMDFDNDFTIKVYDLGGHERIRDIWPNYFAEVHGIMYVVDISDEERLDENYEMIHKVGNCGIWGKNKKGMNKQILRQRIQTLSAHLREIVKLLVYNKRQIKLSQILSLRHQAQLNHLPLIHNRQHAPYAIRLIRFIIGQFSELTSSEVEIKDQVDNRFAIGQPKPHHEETRLATTLVSNVDDSDVESICVRKCPEAPRKKVQIRRKICIKKAQPLKSRLKMTTSLRFMCFISHDGVIWQSAYELHILFEYPTAENHIAQLPYSLPQIFANWCNWDECPALSAFRIRTVSYEQLDYCQTTSILKCLQPGVELPMILGSQTNLVGSAPQQHPPMSPQVNVSSPHFEPYRVPASLHTAQTATAQPSSEYQLRKVNSEPNLKMRIRAKLLSKGSSPVQNQNSFNFTHPQLKRSDSETSGNGSTAGNLAMDTLLTNAANAFPPHLIMPSPSLPNLAAPTLAQTPHLPIDLASLMAAAQLTPFLSLPSLFKTHIGLGAGVLEEEVADRTKLTPGIATLGALSQQLPVFGNPSLLKQQLRELVLRRKSLVREEPEDDDSLSAQPVLSPGHLPPSHGLGDVIGGKATGLAYDSSMARHECVCGESSSHVEHGGRVQSIWARLLERGLVQKCEKIAAKKASLEQLRMVHSPTYVTFFAVSPTACLKMEASQLPLKSFVQLPCGGIGIDSDTYFNDATTQTAARVAAGSLIELASQVAENRLRNGFACIRPPGHHSERDQAMGFCFFNNVAITARYLQHKYPQQCARIAIIDWDVHHGNGTQLCFEEDPNVLYLSLHRHDNGNFFPGTGAVTEIGRGAGKGFSVNVPFSGGVMRDADYLAAWRVIVQPILEQFQPTFILVSAGFDACCGHPNALGGYKISAEMFGYMTRQLMGFAGGRVVLALEGGYDLASISDAAEQCVKVLCGDDDKAGVLTNEALEGLPCLSAQETIQKVIAIHKGHWPALTAEQGLSISELHWQTVGRQFQKLTMSSVQ